ncbi:MAG: ComEC/Rec2 family competence protein [Planctomycetes bacterium]|nr:ComEC/Rec2 family competence protein [Planctomycetota bacterium]
MARIRCKTARNVQRLDPDPPRHRDLLAWLRTTARGMLTDDLATGSDEEASLLEAMVLGHRSGLDRRLNDIFIRAGCIHFLAVSGVHVGIVMFFVWWACVLLGLKRSGRAFAMMAAVILYAAVTEPRPPVLRATVISLIYCVSLLLRRERSYLNWISICAVVLAVFDPAMVFDLGYQLSFAAVFGVSYVSPALTQGISVLRARWDRVARGRPFEQQDRALARALRPRRPLVLRIPLGAFRRSWRFLAGAFPISVGAWVITLPLIAVYFHRIHVWGPLNSVLVLPLVAVSMLLGFAKLITGIISPTVGSAIGWALSVVDGALLVLVEKLATLPGASLAMEAPPRWVTTSFYLFLALLVWAFPRERRVIQEREADPNIKPAQPPSPPLRRAQRRACLVALLVLVATITTWQWPAAREDRLVVTVLSVGAGSATVIELPDGRTVLYDAGSSRPSDVGRSVVVPFLRHRGIGRIDRVYLSHPNLDHFSGLPTIISEIPTGPIIVNRYFEQRSGPRSPSRHLLKLLAKSNHPVQTIDPSGGSWTVSGVTFEYLAPAADFPQEVTTNDTSTVLRLTYGGHSILFTGDVEERALRALIAHGNLHADVLLLPHHGGVETSTPAFIRAVDPIAVIRSSAEPMRETLSGLPYAVGRIPLYNTADVGAIRIVIEDGGLTIGD